MTDPLRIIAAGLTTVPEPELMDFLKKYLAEEPVDALVLGLPLHEDGSEGQLYQQVRRKGKQIAKAFPGLLVEYWDERYTSRMARAIILQSGLGKMKRREKDRVDKVSAGLILQEYLEYTEKIARS